MASEKYEKARKSRESFMTGGVKITFPAFDALPSMTLYLGTANFESADGEEYTAGLREIPGVRFRSGAAQDSVEFALNDPDAVWYEKIKPYEDVFEDSEIVVKEFLETEDDVLEGEITMTGFLEKFSLNESDFSLSFSGISDMSRTGFPVGGRILTKRHCGARFNINGLLSALIDACGWQVGQGGNPLFCTHKRTGLDGCEDHLNSHRFFAVEGLTSAQIQYVAGGGIGGGGWDYGGNGAGECFAGKTLIWMADDTCKPISKIQVNDLVWSFDPAGELVPRRVLKTFRHRAGHSLKVDFGKNRILEVKPKHFFLTGDDLFQPVGELSSGNTVRFRKDASMSGKWFDLTIRRLQEKYESVRMFNFAVEETMTYFVVLADGAKIGVHNLKDYQPLQN